MQSYYVVGFLDESTKTIITLKAQKFGYDCAFYEYGSGTIIEFYNYKQGKVKKSLKIQN